MVRISFVIDGEEHEVVGAPTRPLCDWDRDITVLGGEDSRNTTGVTLRLDESNDSSIAAWVGAEDFAANFQGQGQVAITRDGDESVLSVVDLSGEATVAPQEAGSDQTFNDAIAGGQRVDATMSFVVRCPNP